MPARNGFTFPDVLIGVLLLSLGILAFAGMQTRAVQDITLGEAAANASFLARSTMDELAAMPYAQCVEKKFHQSLGRVQYEVDVSLEEQAALRVKDITVTVSWDGKHTQKYRLTKVKEK